jgi:hypothetical protein
LDDGLMRVRDFAAACGCTPQNIYGHLKTYASDLEGHTFQGKGRQGVLLDGYAMDFLRSIMYPKEISNSSLMDEINKLRAQLLQMGVENTRLASQLATTEGERDRAVLEAGQAQNLLQASNEQQEQQAQELAAARQEAQEAQDKAHAAEERLEALRGRSWLERLMRKGEDF